jgi:hypothetical protein
VILTRHIYNYVTNCFAVRVRVCLRRKESEEREELDNTTALMTQRELEGFNIFPEPSNPLE